MAARTKTGRRKGDREWASELPGPIAGWFDRRGWRPRAHQSALIKKAGAGRDTLLIAPTGAGKTLAGFLPSLVDLLSDDWRGQSDHVHELHTLYISPLKALAVDVARNLTEPVAEMGLDLTVETRTGDTSVAQETASAIAAAEHPADHA